MTVSDCGSAKNTLRPTPSPIRTGKSPERRPGMLLIGAGKRRRGRGDRREAMVDALAASRLADGRCLRLRWVMERTDLRVYAKPTAGAGPEKHPPSRKSPNPTEGVPRPERILLFSLKEHRTTLGEVRPLPRLWTRGGAQRRPISRARPD